MAQLETQHPALSSEDAAVVERVRALLGRTDHPSFFKRVKEALKLEEGEKDLSKRFDWARASRTSEGIIVPGVPAQRAKLLISSNVEQGAKDILIGQQGSLMAYAKPLDNVLAIMDPLESISRIEAEHNKTKRLPPIATASSVFKLNKPVTPETYKHLNRAFITHEICHLDNDPTKLFTDKNGELACYIQTNKELARKNELKEVSKEEIINYIAASYPPPVWARELLVYTGGKFNKETWNVLPGSKSFDAAIAGAIVRLEFDLDSLQGRDRIQPLTSIAIFKDTLSHPKDSAHIKELWFGVMRQVEAEYDSIHVKTDPIRKAEFTRTRMNEFGDYLDGKRASFKFNLSFMDKETFIKQRANDTN